MAVLLLAPLASVRAGELDLYPAPPGLPASDRFQVEVREKAQSDWRQVFVCQSVSSLDKTPEASWASFSFSGQVELRVTPLQGACHSVVIRPKAFQLPVAIAQGQVLLSLHEPRKISLEIDGDPDHPLFIFADPLADLNTADCDMIQWTRCLAADKATS